MSAKPRLLVITPDYPPTHGGIQLLAHRLATGMGGLHTRVLTLDCPGAARFDAGSGVATRRVRVGRRAGAARNLALDAVAVADAVRFRPHATLSVHIVASPAAAGIRRVLGAPTVQYFHAKEIGHRPRLAAFAARRADASIAVSAYTAGLLAAVGAPAQRVRLIPPGVDLPAAAPAHDQAPETSPQAHEQAPETAPQAHEQASEAVPPADAQAPRRPTFVTIARLEDRYKGHDVLVDALALVRGRVPDVEWVVIGDGPLRGELEARVRARGVADSARFLGAVPDERRDRWLRRADVLAMPSRLPGDGRAGEGFGIVYLEAGAHGTPVVAGNVAGALDAVADGESGLLVDPTDPRAVADAIAAVLLDRDLARRLGDGGARRAQGFAWPRIAERVEAVVREQLRN
jgi:phosphatidylinositol alpha-1,6-mannosyltransferase